MLSSRACRRKDGLREHTQAFTASIHLLKLAYHIQATPISMHCRCSTLPRCLHPLVTCEIQYHRRVRYAVSRPCNKIECARPAVALAATVIYWHATQAVGSLAHLSISESSVSKLLIISVKAPDHALPRNQLLDAHCNFLV